MKLKNIILTLMVLFLALGLSGLIYSKSNTESKSDDKIIQSSAISLSNLTYGKDSLKTYTIDDYEKFLIDYEDEGLPEVYITEFLFDGSSMYKTYDLDDFIKDGNNTEVETLKTTVLNIHKGGNYELTGELTGGMIAVNTNNIDSDINITLDNVKIDTDSKKIPAIYVYNKNINYTDHKVTIKTKENTKNYIEGGKLKKVSLIPSEKLSSYTSRYTSDEARTNYNTYTNYYGVYTAKEIEKVLFASVTADNEDLNDGDPYYFYKGAGAVSSDIDLYFEGKGLLKVTSKNKEGIETKGNLEFLGKTGDYIVYSEDDCLNTTTDGTNNRNTLTINVNSLTAIVDNSADEGDAIDSNGKLIINGGTIIAIAKNGSDTGLDSETGTTINAGTILATGDMYDQISNDSKQNFMVFNFSSKIESGNIISLLDENDNHLFSYISDRDFSYLIYSSNDLKEGTYQLYKEGTFTKEEDKVFYTNLSNYTKGTRLGYASLGTNNMNPGGRGGQGMGIPFPTSSSITNSEFTISGVSNIYSGVQELTN